MIYIYTSVRILIIYLNPCSFSMPTRTSVSMLEDPVIRPMPTGARSRSMFAFVAVENKFVV